MGRFLFYGKIDKGGIKCQEYQSISPPQAQPFWEEHQRKDKERNPQHPKDITGQQSFVHNGYGSNY